MNKTALSIAAALCVLGASTAAQADSVQFPGFAHGSQTVTFTVPAKSPATGNVSATVNAGGFLTSLNGGPTFTSYCVDLYQYISFGTTYTDYFPATPHVFANSSAYVDLGRLFTVAAGSVIDAAHEAAFQMAVWEIAYENGNVGYGLGTGVATFAASAEATSFASGWLTQLSSARSQTIGVLDSAGQQDVIYAPVPEPAEIALMLGGLAAVAGVVRRRKKAGAAA